MTVGVTVIWKISCNFLCYGVKVVSTPEAEQPTMNPQANYERTQPEYQEDAEPICIPNPDNTGEEF